MKALPTRRASLVFAAKAAVHRLLRSRRDWTDPGVRCWPGGTRRGDARHLWGEAVSALTAGYTDQERRLELGKIENLRVALRAIDGIDIPAGGVFSFWAQIGRPLARRGYVAGRELREGCIIPSVGGGLCQLSNALYQAALGAGLDILERHPHSHVVPGSHAELGTDATVFWNYVDLRFADKQAFRIEASMDRERLRVRILKEQARPRRIAAFDTPLATQDAASASCETCGELSCFRRAGLPPPTIGRRSAFLVDAVWPEFDAWIAGARSGQDRLLLPLDGKARGKPQYGWTTAGFGNVETFAWLTLWRALASRRLGAKGAARQQSLFLFRERFARAYASALRYDDEHLIVSQEILPYLWRMGVLQGRSYDVLMTAPPMAVTQRQLDAAARCHPSSTTLADFRAPAELLEMEAAALAQAARIVTPHQRVAAMFSNAVLLPWHTSRQAVPARPGGNIVFPASTLGRKGAYELRAAARELGLTLVLDGPVLESADFWEDVDTVRTAPDGAWLDGAAVVVLPAWSEPRPLRLLQALDQGVAVIATPACGLAPHARLTLVEAGDVAALIAALRPYAKRGAPAGPA